MDLFCYLRAERNPSARKGYHERAGDERVTRENIS
jgi:hypothetical protein